MKLKPEQIKEIQDAVSEALNDMLPKFMENDLKSRHMGAMEASIGHADFLDGRTASITIRVEVETEKVD
jgi:hypothetical protein